MAQDFLIDNALGHFTFEHSQDGFNGRLSHLQETLISPAERVRGQQNIVKLEQRIIRRQRFFLEDIKGRTSDPLIFEHSI